jgi:hypothetical protein
VTCTFSFTGSADSFTVPGGVTQVAIDAKGAQGGTAGNGNLGGSGAEIQASFPVTPNETLQVVVGGAGVSGAGGGASFVFRSATTAGLLIAAAGGGGGNGATFGISASATTTASDGIGGPCTGGVAGTGGNGGGAGSGNFGGGPCLHSAGGGGLLTNGGDGNSGNTGGKALANGAAGGTSGGGFGGGGGGAGAGGGGYNGGGGGDGGNGGGGGGSFSASTPISTGANNGDGTVTITYLACAAGQTAHVLTASTNVGTINGLFCVNPSTGIGSYGQLSHGPVTGTGFARQIFGATQITALGTNLNLAGNAFGGANRFIETAPTFAIGTFSLS